MSKYIKFVAFGDNHGDMVDEDVSSALFKFIKSYAPEERIHLGDCFDFRSIRSGRSMKEEGESLDDDLQGGKHFLQHTCPTVFHYGNHEDRLDQIIHSSHNAMAKDYCEEIDASIRTTLKVGGCKKIYPYHAEEGVHTLGKIRTVHGYTCGVRAVEEHAIHYGLETGAVLMGHIHSIQQTNARRYRGTVGFSGGCICKKREMRYAKNRLATSKWGAGWLYGFVQGNDWKVWQAHRVGKEFIFSHESK